MVLNFIFPFLLFLTGSDSLVYINSSGQISFSGIVETASPFKNSINSIKKAGVEISGGIIAKKNNATWGFYDRNGKILNDSNTSFQVINPQKIAVRKNYRWGVIDYEGRIIVAYHYAEIKKTGDILLGKEYNKIEVRNNTFQTEGELAFNNVFLLDSAFLSYEIDGKYGLYNYLSKIRITEPFYDKIVGFKEQLYLVTKDKKSGLINRQGKVVIPLEYDEIEKDALNFIKVTTTRTNEFSGIFSLSGRVIIPPIYEEIGRYTDGLFPVKKEGFWGYVDDNGGQVTPFFYNNAGAFSHGIAPVTRGYMAGIIDKKGNWVEFPDYSEIIPLNDSLWLWKKSFGMGFYDPIERKLHKEFFTELKRLELGYFSFLKEGNYGLLSPQLKIVLKSQYSHIEVFGKEKVILASKGLYYYIYYLNGNLKVFMNYPFTKFLPYTEGMALVVQNDKYGFIDKDGLLLVSTQYDEARPFSHGMAAVKIGRKWGFVDTKENIIVSPYYDEASDFKNGTAAVKKDGKYGFVDRRGKEITKTQFDVVQFLPGGNYIIKQNNRYGLVNKMGIETINPIYKDCYELTDNVLKIRLITKYGLVDARNTPLTKAEFDDIRYWPEGKKFIFITKKDWQPVK